MVWEGGGGCWRDTGDEEERLGSRIPKVMGTRRCLSGLLRFDPTSCSWVSENGTRGHLNNFEPFCNILQ